MPRGASTRDIRQAYRRLVKTAHPDAGARADPARFRRITEAYDVLSDPDRRSVYDRSLDGRVPPTAPTPRPGPRRPYGRYVAVAAVVAAIAVVAYLAVATAQQSVGDPCLVGIWVAGDFDVQFRGVLDGREVAAPIRGGAGVVVTVARDGTVRSDYSGAATLTGSGIEGTYAGTTIENWDAADGRLRLSRADLSKLTFTARINGRPPDAPSAPAVVDGEFPYTCSPTTLDIGPYHYTRG